MKANIKTSNYWAIKDFSIGNNERMQGNKLIALYSLIQKKGEKIPENLKRMYKQPKAN
jgi:hypothetical protein